MDARSVSFQLVLARFPMCRSSLIISSSFSSRPLMSTSTFAPLGGVADSSTIMQGLNPSSVALAFWLYALCPSSRMISGLQQAERIAEGGLRVPSPEAAVLLERVEVRHFVEALPMAVHIVVRGEEAVEAAAVPEHSELLPGLPVGRRQHQQQHAQVLLDVPRAESAGLLQRQGPAGRCHVELLAVRMVAILQGLEGLVVDLRGGDDPQHKSRSPPAVVRVDEAHHLGREQSLATAGGNLEAEGRKRLAQPVPARMVDA